VTERLLSWSPQEGTDRQQVPAVLLLLLLLLGVEAQHVPQQRVHVSRGCGVSATYGRLSEKNSKTFFFEFFFLSLLNYSTVSILISGKVRAASFCY